MNSPIERHRRLSFVVAGVPDCSLSRHNSSARATSGGSICPHKPANSDKTKSRASISFFRRLSSRFKKEHFRLCEMFSLDQHMNGFV